MTEVRREAQRRAGQEHSRNLVSPAEALKRREAWKYAALALVLAERPHEFEYELGGYVFDLALLDTKTLIEFDGPYHDGISQVAVDSDKEEAAKRAGFVLVRRSVAAGVKIEADLLANL